MVTNCFESIKLDILLNEFNDKSNILYLFVFESKDELSRTNNSNYDNILKY
jgi:hypothetical protein